jgi:hypothetical protein
MIQLANDPNASRSFLRTAPAAARGGSETAVRRGRPGHAWPFLSRYAERPAQQANSKPAANDSGS